MPPTSAPLNPSSAVSDDFDVAPASLIRASVAPATTS